MARIIYTDMSGIEQTIAIGTNYPLITIGRAVDCDIRSNRKSVSRHHAEFKFENNQVHVIDLNSSNGTFVIIDDQRRSIIGRQTIANNDEVWCGDFVLRYLNDDAIQDRRPPVPTFTSKPELSFATHPTDRPMSGSQPLGLTPTVPPPFGSPSNAPPAFGRPSSAPLGLLEQSGFDPLTTDIDDLEQLLAEKSSIEELATRQAAEIDRLESLIGAVKDDAAKSVQLLQSERDKTEEEKRRLREELEAQKPDSSIVVDLENEVVELRGINDNLRIQMAQSGDEIKDDFDVQLGQKNDEIDELGRENDKLGKLNDDVSAKLEEAKSEIQILTSHLQGLNEELSDSAESAKLSEEWETKLLAANRDKEALQSAHDTLAKRNETQETSISDLNDTVFQLKKEIEELNSNLQAAKTESSNAELVTFLTRLERLTDAIQRTDLSPLSTVDRVRLQSAIREAKPKATLQAFIEKNK